jgi:GxxExxY protein
VHVHRLLLNVSSDNPYQSRHAALELSHQVIGAAIEVHRCLGPGLLESVYEASLCRELSLRKIAYVRQSRVPVSYKGQLLDCEF